MTLDILVCALVLVAVQLRISASLLSVRGRIILSVVVFVWSVLPFPWGLAPWVISYLAGFSITSGLLAMLAIQHRIAGHYWLPLKQLRGACLMLVLMGLPRLGFLANFLSLPVVSGFISASGILMRASARPYVNSYLFWLSTRPDRKSALRSGWGSTPGLNTGRRMSAPPSAPDTPSTIDSTAESST